MAASFLDAAFFADDFFAADFVAVAFFAGFLPGMLDDLVDFDDLAPDFAVDSVVMFDSFFCSRVLAVWLESQGSAVRNTLQALVTMVSRRPGHSTFLPDVKLAPDEWLHVAGLIAIPEAVKSPAWSRALAFRLIHSVAPLDYHVARTSPLSKP